MCDPKAIGLALEEIAILLELSGQSRYKAQAYERGAQIVLSLGDALGPLVADDKLTEHEGIGPSLSQQIVELWNTGSSSLLHRLRSEHPPGTAELARVPGLSPRRIRALQTGLGITSIEELRVACLARRVRTVKGFGEKLEQRLLATLTRREAEAQGETRVLLADALKLATRLQRQLIASGAASHVHLVGAARRRDETVAELELVLEDATPDSLWERIESLPSVVRTDRGRQSALLTDGIPVYLYATQAERVGARVLSATGNEAHLWALRERAAERGFVLERDALTVAEGELSAASADESAVYRVLGLSFVPPELRDGGRELAWAERGPLDDLLTDSDIVGMVHCHTTHSDGKNSIEEMARAAEARGMQYITITDHSPSAHYAGGVTLDGLKRQWDEIAEVQQRVAIRILRGTESDILSDGCLDYPDAVLEQLDVVIASIHTRGRMTRDEMTERLTRAMRLPQFKIWGHALGRLLLQRDPIDCDVPAVLDALAGARGAIEINGDPHRLDLPPRWLPEARERGIPFVVSVDAHSTRGFDALSYGVMMARRGGLRRAEVLNTLPTEAFAARVRPSG